ncbi:MAG: hypothetical protein K0R39_4243, partial [Symbiobacteriaceae bacterium]|nr:hypothetical protein [Symbiobacteriaceae bacterium]
MCDEDGSHILESFATGAPLTRRPENSTNRLHEKFVYCSVRAVAGYGRNPYLTMSIRTPRLR